MYNAHTINVRLPTLFRLIEYIVCQELYNLRTVPLSENLDSINMQFTIDLSGFFPNFLGCTLWHLRSKVSYRRVILYPLFSFNCLKIGCKTRFDSGFLLWYKVICKSQIWLVFMDRWKNMDTHFYLTSETPVYYWQHRGVHHMVSGHMQ